MGPKRPRRFGLNRLKRKREAAGAAVFFFFPPSSRDVWTIGFDAMPYRFGNLKNYALLWDILLPVVDHSAGHFFIAWITGIKEREKMK